MGLDSTSSLPPKRVTLKFERDTNGYQLVLMLCYASHLVVLALYTSMNKKRHFSKVLLLCFALSTIIYVSMAVLGYLMFEPGVESPVTLNLPIDELGSRIAIYNHIDHSPSIVYALLLKLVVISTKSWFRIDYQKKKQFKILVQTALVATQVIVAMALPFFGHLMLLAGALLGATASLAIPCLCYLKISRLNNLSLGNVERLFICSIVILSVFIVVFGTYTSLLDIFTGIRH